MVDFRVCEGHGWNVRENQWQIRVICIQFNEGAGAECKAIETPSQMHIITHLQTFRPHGGRARVAQRGGIKAVGGLDKNNKKGR